MTLSVNLLSSLIGIKLLVNQRSSPSSQILHRELELKVKDTWANHRQWDRENHYHSEEVRGCGKLWGACGLCR